MADIVFTNLIAKLSMDPDFGAADDYEKRLGKIRQSWKEIGAAATVALGAIADEAVKTTLAMDKLGNSVELTLAEQLGAGAKNIDYAAEAFSVASQNAIAYADSLRLVGEASKLEGDLAANAQALGRFQKIADTDYQTAASAVIAGTRATGLAAPELVRLSTQIAGRQAEDLLEAFQQEGAHFQASEFDAAEALQLFQLGRARTGQTYDQLGNFIATVFETVREPDRLAKGTDALQIAAQNRDLAAFITAGSRMTEQQRADVFGEASSFVGAIGEIESLDIQQEQRDSLRHIEALLEEQSMSAAGRQLAAQNVAAYGDMQRSARFEGPVAQAYGFAAGLNPELASWVQGGGGAVASAASTIGASVLGPYIAGRFLNRSGGGAAQAAGQAAARGIGRQTIGQSLAAAGRRQLLSGGARGIAGRAAGRFVPGLGWALLGHDVLSILGGVAESQGWVDEGVIPRWLGGSGGSRNTPANVVNHYNFQIAISGAQDPAAIAAAIDAHFQQALTDANQSVQSDVEA